MRNGKRRKAVATVHRKVTTDTVVPSRMTTWLRKAYPKSAPTRGHCYLVALCGTSYPTR